MIIDPRDALVLAHIRANDLRAEAAVARTTSRCRKRIVAATLRRLADRLDPTPLVQRPAL